MSEDQVRCNICGEIYRAIPSYIKLVCNSCYEKRPSDATGLTREFLDVLKSIKRALGNSPNKYAVKVVSDEIEKYLSEKDHE